MGSTSYIHHNHHLHLWPTKMFRENNYRLIFSVSTPVVHCFTIVRIKKTEKGMNWDSV